MSASNSRKFRELELTTEIERMGFTSARIIGKLLSLTHKSAEDPVQCQFDINNIFAGVKKLQNAIAANNKINLDESYHSGKFAIYFSDLLVKSVEQEHARREADRNRDQEDKQKIIDEINKDRSTIGDISLESWEAIRNQKYQVLRDTVKQNIPSLWIPLEFTLSVKCIINIADVDRPFAGIVLGAPSTLKTTTLRMLNKWPQTFYTDDFTTRSLVSHSTTATKEELTEIDMLPHWKNKFVLLPELAPIFTTKDEDLMHLIGILARVLDGQGYISNSGAHGQRGYNEKIMFVLAGASVEIPHRVYKALGYVGPKLYFLRLPKEKPRSLDERLLNLKEDFAHKEQKVQAALFDYLKWLEIRPDMQTEKESSLQKIQWNYESDNEDALKYILNLSELLAPLRGVAQTWETKGTQGSDYGYTIPIVEHTSRAEKQLYNLARGHALANGRNFVTMEDIPVVIKVVLSTGPAERVSILDQLISAGGSLDTAQITGALEMAKGTALKTMTELTLLGLVDMTPRLGTEDLAEETGQNKDPKKIKLKDSFAWLKTKEFEALKEGFEIPEVGEQE